MPRSRLLTLTLCFTLVACGGGDDAAAPTPAPTAGGGGSIGSGGPDAGNGGASAGNGGAPAGTGGASTGGGGAGGGGAAGGCVRAPKPADRARFVVVGHVNSGPTGTKSKDWEVLDLAADGALSRPGRKFQMGAARDERIAFTPDGEIGVAAQDDGTLGIFRLDEAGQPTVIDAAYKGGFGYASAVTLSPDGATAYVTNENWPDSGGGLYAFSIGCDGTPKDLGKLVSTKNAWGGVAVLSASDAVLFSRETIGAPSGHQIIRLGLTPPAKVTASVDLFGDDAAIIVARAQSPDGRLVLFVDNSAFDGTERLGVVDTSGGGLAKAQVLDGFPEAASVAVSPAGDAAIVAMWGSDSYAVLKLQPGAAPPVTVDKKVKGIQVPGALTTIDRGALAGRVLIGEVRGLYQLHFEAGGVKDLGVFSLGAGVENLVTAIGVTP